jgi:hypothetical protein
MTQVGGAIPIIRPRTGTVKKFMLQLHEFDPAQMEPIGDRYIVETIPVEETVKFGSFIVMAQVGADTNPRDPSGNPTVERRGVLPAVIIAVGNGHLLGLPDPRLVLQYSDDLAPLNSEVERHSADVPMFFRPGDVALLDMNAKGRSLKIVDREIRVVNQLDLLVKLPVRLEWTEEGWKHEGEAFDQAE